MNFELGKPKCPKDQTCKFGSLRKKRLLCFAFFLESKRLLRANLLFLIFYFVWPPACYAKGAWIPLYGIAQQIVNRFCPEVA